MRRGGAIASLLLVTVAGLALAAEPSHKPAAAQTRGLAPHTGLLRSDRVIYDLNKGVTTAEGHVEIDYNGYILMADKIVYDQNADQVTADGHVTLLSPDGNTAFSNHAVLTNKLRDGVLAGFQALIGKNGRLAGLHAVRTNDGTHTTITTGAYTPCKICNQPGQRTPMWQVKAARVIYDQPAHKILFHDAILEAFGIPVAYTPFFSQSDPTVKHSSGLLIPELGHSTNLGDYLRIPVYVSLTDLRDFTIAPMLTTAAGYEIEGEYRERWDQGGMWFQPSAAINPHGGFNDNHYETYSSIFGAGLVPIDNIWHVGFDVQLTSNETYLQRYKIQQLQELTNDLYLEGISGQSHLSITGYFFQGLETTDNNSHFPVVLPLIDYTYIPSLTWLGGNFRFDFNTASVSRLVGEDDQRFTGEANWRLPLVTQNGQLFTVQADLRGDLYHIDNPQMSSVPTTDHYISRGLPYVALDWRWPFVTESASGKTSYIFEPIAQIIGAPYGGNPAGIPNEDSTDFQFDETNIFSFNRLPGYDLVETGPRANVGLRTQAILPTGSLEFLVGQEYRLKPDPIFAPDSGASGTTSDLVSRVTANFPPHFSVTERLEVDTRTGTLDRNEVYLDAYYGLTTFEISYLKVPEEEVTLGLPAREEINGQAQIQLWKYWILYASGQRNLATDTMISDEFGLGYQNECFAVSVSYQRTYTTDRDIPPSTDVLMRVNLLTGDQPEDTTTLFRQHLYPHIPL